MADSTQQNNGRGQRVVPAKSSAAEGLKELFIDELKDIIYAERALVKLYQRWQITQVIQNYRLLSRSMLR